MVPSASKATSENTPVIPSKGSPRTAPADAAANPAGQFALLEAERQRLEQFIQQQLEHLHQGRQALLAEKQANEQALQARQQELEHQSQALMNRLKELHEREQLQTDRFNDALPERHAGYRRRRFSSLIDRSKIVDEPDPEIKALREQLQELKQSLVLSQGERDAAWEELSAQRSRVLQLESTVAERDVALAKLRQSAEKPEGVPTPEAELARLKKQAEEKEHLWRQVQEQRQLLERVRKDHETAREALVQEWQRKLQQLQSELDAAREENQRLAQEPPEAWAQQEEEYTALTRELRDREAELKEQLQFLSQEQQRLEKLRAEIGDRNRVLEQDRQQLEEQNRQLLLRDEHSRLREAELKEMKELAEQENARDRAALVQERAQIARLREALRLEKTQAKSRKSGS